MQIYKDTIKKTELARECSKHYYRFKFKIQYTNNIGSLHIKNKEILKIIQNTGNLVGFEAFKVFCRIK